MLHLENYHWKKLHEKLLAPILMIAECYTITHCCLKLMANIKGSKYYSKNNASTLTAIYKAYQSLVIPHSHLTCW